MPRAAQAGDLHLVVEDLRFTRFGLWDQGLVEHVKDVLADLLELRLDLLTVVTDGPHVLVRALGFLLLLDRRDDAPRGTSGSDNILVGDRQEIPLVDCELTTELHSNMSIARSVGEQEVLHAL